MLSWRRGLRYIGWEILAGVVVMVAAGLTYPHLTWPRADLKPLLLQEPLQSPTHLAALPDGSGEVVVREQESRILRFHPDASRAAEVLLDLGDRIVIGGGENGLLAGAFHPAFARDGRFFVSYNAGDPRRPLHPQRRIGGDLRRERPDLPARVQYGPGEGRDLRISSLAEDMRGSRTRSI